MDLKPCPFCGSENIDPEEWRADDGRSGPGCGECGASAELDHWNTRATDAQLAAVTKERDAWMNRAQDHDTRALEYSKQLAALTRERDDLVSAFDDFGYKLALAFDPEGGTDCDKATLLQAASMTRELRERADKSEAENATLRAHIEAKDAALKKASVMHACAAIRNDVEEAEATRRVAAQKADRILAEMEAALALGKGDA